MYIFYFSDNKETVLEEAATKIKDILKHFQKIATELSGLDSYQYMRAYSPGNLNICIYFTQQCLLVAIVLV